MALLTTLKIINFPNDYKVLDFRLHMARDYNHFIPETAPSCERLEITVVAPEADDYTFYEWYKSRSLLSGKLSYELPVSIKHTHYEKRVIEFRDAQCYSYTESYDIDTQNRRMLKLTVIPEHVIMNEIAFDKL